MYTLSICVHIGIYIHNNINIVCIYFMVLFEFLFLLYAVIILKTTRALY